MVNSASSKLGRPGAGSFRSGCEWRVSQTSRSGKPFRIYGSNTVDVNNIYLSTGGGGNLRMRGYSEILQGHASPHGLLGGSHALGDEQWHRVDVLMSESGPNLFAVHIDGGLDFEFGPGLPGVNADNGPKNEQWVRNPFLGDGHTVGIGGMLDGPTDNNNFGARGYYEFDDFFVDYTWARVEVGNAATWSAVTRKEIQVPVAWSNSGVTFRMNRGAFLPSEPIYLYVVDPTGAVNPNGYLLSTEVVSGVPPHGAWRCPHLAVACGAVAQGQRLSSRSAELRPHSTRGTCRQVTASGRARRPRAGCAVDSKMAA